MVGSTRLVISGSSEGFLRRGLITTSFRHGGTMPVLNFLETPNLEQILLMSQHEQMNHFDLVECSRSGDSYSEQ